MEESTRIEINGMGYKEMLRLWRHSASGNPMFQGETGEYFAKVMAEKKSALCNLDQVIASKEVGW